MKGENRESRDRSSFTRTVSLTQSIRRSWIRLHKQRQTPPHNIMPDEQSESAIKWMDELKNEMMAAMDIPYIDEECNEVDNIITLGIQELNCSDAAEHIETTTADQPGNQSIRFNFTDTPRKADFDTYRSDSKEEKVDSTCSSDNDNKTTMVKSKSANLQLFRIFRGKTKSPERVASVPNSETRDTLKLPSWYYSGVGGPKAEADKKMIPRSSTFPAYNSSPKSVSPGHLVKETTIIEQAESKGAFGPRNSIKKRVIKRLQKTIQTLKQDIVVPRTTSPPPPHKPKQESKEEETEAKHTILKRRVSFQEDAGKDSDLGNLVRSLKGQTIKGKPHPSDRALIRSMSDLMGVQMAAKKMRKAPEKDPQKKKMMKEWSKTYEGMCVRAQKLEQAIECAEQEDLIVKPVHQIESLPVNSPPSRGKKSSSKKKSKKRESVGDTGSFFSVFSQASSETVTSIDLGETSEKRQRQRLTKSQSLDMSVGSNCSSIESNEEEEEKQ